LRNGRTQPLHTFFIRSSHLGDKTTTRLCSANCTLVLTIIQEITVMKSKFSMGLPIVTVVLALIVGLAAVQPIAAQGPNVKQVFVGPLSPNLCSTTDYTAIVAKALGLTAPELRLALAKGRTIQQLATEKKVELKTITDAVEAARKADIEQAVKDGLLPKEVADLTAPANKDSADGAVIRVVPGAPGVPGGVPDVEVSIGGEFGVTLSIAGSYGVSPRNTVRPMIVSAQAIGVTCVDLAKALREGESIVHVATTKNIKAQVVIDALVKAYQDALAQDVKEGLITQAQAENEGSRLVERATAMISQRGGMFPMLRPIVGGIRGPRPSRGNMGPGVAPDAPPAPSTPPPPAPTAVK
jgi:hypothetical protein